MSLLWTNANVLWLLAAVAGLTAFLLAAGGRRRRALEGFADAGLLNRLISGAAMRRRVAVSVLRTAVLATLVVAAAGPRWGFRWEEVHREGIDILIALDTSRSMLAEDVKPNRLERAKLAVLDLVDRLDGDRIGLVVFAGSAFLECPLTLDYGAFERTLRTTKVGVIPVGGTALSRAIDTSLDAFEARQGKHEALILITDGEDHEGDVEAAAERARESGVRIYTVGIGTSDGELIPLGKEHGAGYVKDRDGQVVKSRLNEQQLQDIALASDGAFVRGVGAALGLDEVFDEHIARMEKRDLKSTLERRHEKRFQFPIAAALLLLLVEVVAAAGRGSRVGRGLRALGRSGVRSAALLLAAPMLVGWLGVGEPQPLAEGGRLYDEGRYAEAVEVYREALIDEPDQVPLQYNLGAALYRDGKFGQAVDTYRSIVARSLDEWTGRASYNLGNALYRLGEGAVEDDPQATIASWQEALLAYRRAMAADYDDVDPKFNHELVTRELEDLARKLEEEKEKEEHEQDEGDQQQPDPDQNQQQEPGDNDDQGEDQQQQQPDEQQEQPPPGQDEKESASSPPEQEEPEEEQEQQQPEQEPQDGDSSEEPDAGPPPEPGPDGQGGGASEPEDRESEEAARAIIDLAQDEELGPEGIDRPTGMIGSRTPVNDW